MTQITFDHIEVQKLELRRGDILVLKLPFGARSAENKFAHDAMTEALRRANITGVQIMIGSVGDELSIIREIEK